MFIKTLVLELIFSKFFFCTFKLDSQGELFFQEFKSTQGTDDRTFCAGPTSGDLTVDKALIERGNKWTADLHDYVNSCKRSIKNVNVTDLFSGKTSRMSTSQIYSLVRHKKCQHHRFLLL
jgi:hypothetical protein